MTAPGAMGHNSHIEENTGNGKSFAIRKWLLDEVGSD